MRETRRLSKSLSNNSYTHSSEYIDDECSTDSGCSSGGSAESTERLAWGRIGNYKSPHARNSHLCNYSNYHLDKPRITQSQERLSISKVRGHSRRNSNKTSRSWSPSESRCHIKVSPSHYSSPMDSRSSNSDSSEKISKVEILKRTFQYLKLGKWGNSGSKEKKLTKKSPKRILREPVSYTYFKGLSGLPTQRVPKNIVQLRTIPCSCQSAINFYKKNIDHR